MSVKHRITVNLDGEEYEALQRLAEGADRSLAWLARRAICDFIEQRERDDAPLFAASMETSVLNRRAAR